MAYLLMKKSEEGKKRQMKKMKVRMTSHGNSSGKERNCGKEALKFLHRTQNAEKHKSIVCVICDWFIIGTETIHYLSK
jgi:hypothetical protein